MENKNQPQGLGTNIGGFADRKHDRLQWSGNEQPDAKGRPLDKKNICNDRRFPSSRKI